MADITMCSNKECNIKDQCYRQQAKPSMHWQAYAEFKPVKNDRAGTDCEYFMRSEAKNEN